MFRLLITLFLALVCLADPTRAEITQASILEAVRAGDIEKVERDLDSAHGEFLSGEAQADDLRRIYGVFGTTDRVVLSFTRDWLDLYPRSPYAHAAQAWNDYQAAWLIRGGGTVRETYPEALELFHRLHDSAWEHARRALNAAPRLLPASDALIRLGMMDRYTMASFDVLDTVMQEDPNWDTLQRAVDATNPNWGRTWETAESMCNHYGPTVTDLAGDHDPVSYCKLYAAASQHARFGDPLFYWYQTALKVTSYPSLDGYRLSLATSAHATREDAEFAYEYLKDLLEDGGWNLPKAEAFDRNIAPKFDYPLIAEAHYRASQKGARKRLAENPHDDDALHGLRLRLHSFKETEPFTFEKVVVHAPDPAEEIEYVRRLLEIRPYDAGLWSDYANLAYPLTRPKALAFRDGPLINAIAYSNHGPYHLNTFTSSKLIMLNMYEKRSLTDRGEDWRKAWDKVDLAKDILCPMVRVQRLRQAVCSVDDSGFCDTSVFEQRESRKKLAIYGAREVCEPVYAAPLEDLIFLPVQVDLMDADG